MRRHSPAFPQYSGKTRETLVFDKLNYRTAPRLGGTVKSHCDYVQETVFGPGNHLGRDIAVAKIDGVAGELFCRACGHSIPSNKRPTALSKQQPKSSVSLDSCESRPASCRSGKGYENFPSSLIGNSQPILHRLLQSTAKPSRRRNRKSRRVDGLRVFIVALLLDFPAR